VNLLTFTDGLDNNSTSLGLPPLEAQDFRGKQADDYQSYIKTQIAGRTVAGKKLTAFSIGVRGSDVSDPAAFTVSLRALASENQNVFELRDYTRLEEQFARIANSLRVSTSTSSLSIVTPSYPEGTVVRITFDTSVSAASSTTFIQGVVAIRNGRYVLTRIEYQNLSSTTGTEVSGVLNGTEVVYTFNGLANFTAPLNLISQWTQGANGAWQINSEYATRSSAHTDITENSAVVYLALDSSNSLSDNYIAQIREAARRFISILYKQQQEATSPSQAWTSSQTQSPGGQLLMREVVGRVLSDIAVSRRFPANTRAAVLMNWGLEVTEMAKEELRATLANQYHCRVINQQIADNLMATSGFHISGAFDEALLQRMGQTLGANIIVLGLLNEYPIASENFWRVDGELVVRVFDVEAGLTLSALGVGRYRW
jgi:hypothetical protein